MTPNEMRERAVALSNAADDHPDRRLPCTEFQIMKLRASVYEIGAQVIDKLEEIRMELR